MPIVDLGDQVAQLSAVTPFAVALMLLAGLIVGIAPSSFPLISVSIGLTPSAGAAATFGQRIFLPLGFAMGVFVVDVALGLLFGFLGFGLLRVLVSWLSLAYLILAALSLLVALALLGVVHFTMPVLFPKLRRPRTFAASFLFGLPFGLSTCPGCTPLLLPVVATAAFSADPLMGATLMGAFGLGRAIPVVAAGALAGRLVASGAGSRYVRVAERVAALLMFGAVLYFLYESARYGGLVT